MSLANDWHELVERDGGVPGDRYQLVQHALMALLPVGVDAAAAAPVDGQPSVVALKGTRLFIVCPVVRETTTETVVDCLPFVDDVIRVSVTDNPHELADAPATADYRRWRFIWPDGRQVDLVGVLRSPGGWSGSGPDAAEKFARVLAGRLDWDVPESG